MFKKSINAFLLLSTLSILNAEVNSSASITDSRNSAASLSSLIKSNYSDFNNKIALPVTSGSQVKTLDGVKSGTINMTCNTDKILMSKISISGSNNITINVKLDINLDGSFEKDLTFNSISGIHTTGVFSCSNNASNCTYYNWDYANGTLQLANISESIAIGAYCINDACGSLYAKNPSQILNDISGTITALIQSSTNLVVTNVMASSSVAEIHAQKYDNCNNTSNDALYGPSSSIPSEATLLSQANNATYTSDTNAVISTISANENTNKVTSSDLADIKTVAATSTNSVTVSSSDPRDISYTSTYKDSSGNFVTSANGSSINFEHMDPEYCMVEWFEMYTSVTTDGNVRGVTASGLKTTKKTETRLCTGEYNNICPINSGETIKYDCGNLNKSINQATGALNTLKGIVDDMICNITK